MNRKNFIFGIVILTLIGCAILNPKKRYQPNSIEYYFFPMHSLEFTKSVEECIKEEKFPCDYLEPEDSLSKFQNKWYSKHLISLEEPILYNQRDTDLEIIRFTHLGTWTNPFSYRIENRNGQIEGTFNKSSGQGGYQAGKRIFHLEKKLNNDDWDSINLKLDSINFWEIPTHDSVMILDGSEYILEVLQKDKYHFVTRTSPEDYGINGYSELCELIITKFDKN